MSPVRARRWVVVAAAVTAVTWGASGAGAGASTTPSATKKFCDAFKNNAIMTQQVFLADPTSDTATALKTKLDAGVTAAKAIAPTAIADDYDVVTSDAPTDFAAITAAEKAVDTWVLAHCKYEVVKVTADDSSVTMPKTVKPGFVAFDMTNNGTTPRRYYGVVPLAAGQTVAQLVASSLDQLRPLLVTEVQTTPGQEAVAYGPITKPGVYVVIDGDSVGTPQPSYTSFTVKK
jgi:hypothetical protein